MFILVQICVALQPQAQGDMMVGIWYRNFTNHQGALADDSCCDNPGQTTPTCPKDQCDTTFVPCGTYVGGKQCNAYPDSSTAVMENMDSFVIQTTIGNVNNGKRSPSLVVNIVPFSSDNIDFSVQTREITGNSRVLMANFKFVIDWMDTFFSNDLHWRQLILKDAYCELGIDVVHQCARHNFGPTCSVYCKPTHQYTCLNDGSKNCTAGWQGPDCDQLVPYCTSGLCQHGGNCTNIHLGYVCSCLPDYWGTHCEYALSYTTTSISPTVLMDQVITSIETVSISTTKKIPGSNGGNEITIVAISVSAGLIGLCLLAAAMYGAYRMKKQKNKEKVQPAPSPPPSYRETLEFRLKNLDF